MARLFADPFDQYGTSTANMLKGIYATAGAEVALSTAHPATGTTGVYISGSNPGLSNESSLRKVLSSAQSKMGAAGRFYFDSLPAGNIGGTIFDFLTSSPVLSQVTCLVDANGCIRFLRGRDYSGLSGETGTLIAQTDPIIVAGSQNHIEVQVNIHDTTGWVRVAVNGVHKYQATGLDTKYNSDNIVSVAQSSGISGGIGAGAFYMDDYILYDFTGTAATDTDFCPTVDGSGVGTNYIAELQCMYLYPNGNTSEDDWLKSTGSSAFALVDETNPDDTDYLYSPTATDLTELSLLDLPVEITYIRGLDLWTRSSKEDAGVAKIKHGMKSVAATADSSEIAVTVSPTYNISQQNVDPNTSARWTRTNLNAAWFRLLRSL